MDLRALIALSALALVSCQRNPTSDGEVYAPPHAPIFMIEDIERDSAALEQRVKELEDSQTPDKFKLSDGGFGYVDTSLGPAAFQWISSKAHGDGTQIKAKIGNPTRADWNRFTIYGSTKNKDDQTSSLIQAQISDTIAEGKWGEVTFQIDGIAPAQIESLSVSSIVVANIGLVP